MTTVVVSGGRNFSNKKVVFNRLDKFHQKYRFSTLVHGNATGLDTLAKEWALSKGITEISCDAKWKDIDVPGAVIKRSRYGAYNVVAGIQRNQFMIDQYKPDYAIIFPGGNGTADMKNRCLQAKKSGIIKKVITVRKRT